MNKWEKRDNCRAVSAVRVEALRQDGGGGKESGMHLNLNSKLKRSPISTNFAGPHMSQ
jgi:hypothetical protein